MNTSAGPPPHWHASVWPDGWNFEKEQYLNPNLKQVGWVLLPDRFHMVVHWPELEDGKSEHGGALMITFEVVDEDVEVRELYAVDMDIEKWIGYFVSKFPPEKWKPFAVAEVTKFLAVEEDRGNAEVMALLASASARKSVDLRKPQQAGAPAKTGGKRHRITTQHLEEVARIYQSASEHGEPPTMAVADHFGVAHSTAAKWVGKARSEGMLEPIPRGGGEQK
ncbi:MAG: hypothetical protein M3O70_24260 [Actinomycetota bacterium]|nr:hypothetical protein [Actinomycetota bacterium]